MKEAASRRLCLSLAALLLLGSTTGCGALQRLRFGMKAMGREAPDYEQLDAERAALDRAIVRPASAAAAPAAYWTQYRGPAGDGVYAELDLALDLTGEGPPLLWSVALGPAYSSTVVAGGLAITMEQRRESEAVVAFSLESGALAWEHAWEARHYDALSKEGPRATPAIGGEAVVGLGATGELRCLELGTGALRWRRSLMESDEENLPYGLSASPRIEGDLVIVQGARSVFALELATGELRWRALDEPTAYATPVVGELAGRSTVVVTTAERVVGLGLDDGSEQWSFPWRVPDGNACTQPLLCGADRVLVSAGYGKGAKLFGLTRTEVGIEAAELWRSGRFKTRFNEPVLLGGYAYGLDEGTLTCLDVETGKRVWKEGRYGYGQMLVFGDRLLIVEEDGEAHVVEISPEGPIEVGRFRALESTMQLNVPTAAHGLLLLRNEGRLACYALQGARQ